MERRRRKAAIIKDVQVREGQLVEAGVTEWLPMPYNGTKRLSREEWHDYQDRRKRHLATNPGYDQGWPGRPSVATAEAVWNLLAPKLAISLSALLPTYRWFDELESYETDSLATRAQQALVVALDAAVLAGQYGRMLTTNTVFDALVARWSDTYRAVRDAGKADCSWDMRAATVRASWRDLLRNGIRLEAIWPIIRQGCPGLYTTARVSQHGRTVDVYEGSPVLVEYAAIIEADAEYRRDGGEHPRLLLADESSPPWQRRSREVAAEWEYNVVEPGQRSIALIKRLEAARLYLHVPTFKKDVDRLERAADDLRDFIHHLYGVDVTASLARPRGRRRTRSGTLKRSPRQWQMLRVSHDDIPYLKPLVELYDREQGQFNELKAVRDQLQKIEKAGGLDERNQIQIRSRFYKLINRRYQPADFWAAEVTSRDIQSERLSDTSRVSLVSSRRGRWFSATATGIEDQYEGWEDNFAGDRRPLVGVDVSSSQLQILAAFLGLDALEEQIRLNPFKDTLAKRAWDMTQDPTDTFKLPGTPKPFKGPDDDRLKEAVKFAVMTHLYGSELKEVAYKLTSSPSEYGPGLGDEENIRRLLAMSDMNEILKKFLPACQAIADIVYERDMYVGVVFTDPFDGTAVRWNPVRRRLHPVTSKETKVYVSLPIGRPDSTTGNYPVDHKKLRRMVAPCLVHMLDAMFASLVVEKLNDLGVRDLVSVHDCWMIPSDAAPVLHEAVAAASEPWLRSLKSVYDDLDRYLGDHHVYGSYVRQWRAQWRRRVARGDNWPQFRVGAPQLTNFDVAQVRPDLG